MAHHPADRPVHVTGEERLHPALRKLGRACIALARWQREQEQQRAARSEPTTDTPASSPSVSVLPATEAKPAAADQERRHD